MFFLGYLFFYSILTTLIDTSIFFSILSFVLGGMLYFNSSSPLQGIAICAFGLLHLISRLCYHSKKMPTKNSSIYSYVKHKGRFKTMDNTIVEVDRLGNKKVRFQPINSFETERYFDEMIEGYNKAVKENIPPLILIPTVIHDFLCIHPFDDGNGRMSRILTLLLLYKFGYFVGRYISIEMLIEESKDSYYEELQNSSEKWHTEENDELPFMKYMLGIIMKAYKECDNRFKLIGGEKLTSPERVFSVIQKSLEPLSKKDIMILCPDISQRTVERALKELQDNEKIRQVGSGRSTKYIKI